MKPNWLRRDILATPISYTLCTTEAQYDSEVRRLKIKGPNPWLNDHAMATCHHFDKSSVGEEGACAIVCIQTPPDKTPIEVAGLLCHEAVHLWQEYCDYIGEKHPGREMEAYVIQWLSQCLMEEYVRQTITTKEPA